MTKATTVFQGRIIRVDVATVALPNGVLLDMERVHHPGGAAVVALDDQGRVCLLRHYRAALDEWLWELPAGKRDGEEPHFQIAQRELEEEVGVRATQWDELGHMVSSPGVFTERVYLYLARGLRSVASHPEPDEVYDVEWVPFAQALARARDGDVVDAKSVIGLFRAATLL